jgi:hypothetical protein
LIFQSGFSNVAENAKQTSFHRSELQKMQNLIEITAGFAFIRN